MLPLGVAMRPSEWRPMNYVFGLFLLFTSTVVWSCTCMGTAPIEMAIAGHPILVEGQVVSLEQVDSQDFGKLTLSATLRVIKVLKGSVDSDEVTVVHAMCYASVYPGNMEMNHTYVLPLTMPAPGRQAANDGFAVAVIGPAPGQYEMAGCAHSGLELDDGVLYSFDYDMGGRRQLKRYMSYSAFRVWWPVAQAGLVSIAFVWGLHKNFGLSALVVSLLLGTAGAYFAAKYRPWMLIPVFLLVSVLCALNFADVLESRVFISEHGVVYWTLSWITPAVILGSGTIGYFARRRAKASAPGGRAH